VLGKRLTHQTPVCDNSFETTQHSCALCFETEQVIGAKVVLQHIARLLDKAVGARPTLELFIVVICGPLLMNMIQVMLPLGGAPGQCCNNSCQ
jgi:hypothetical protein